MRTMTRDEVREFDRHCIEDLGVPGIVLMENAGRQVAQEAAIMLLEAGGHQALVVAGRGNNGGDGFVVARHLLLRRYAPAVLLLADPRNLTGDAKTNFDLLAPLGIPVTVLSEDGARAAEQISAAAAQADLVIDALLGTGLAGEVREPHLSAIRAINECGKPVLAIDIPSGLDADTGRPLGAAVRARVTVTFVARKAGFLAPEAAQYLGRVTVADIGVPANK